MMFVTPMCEVRWDENRRPDLRGDCRVLLRVPEDRVEAIVAVLLLNNVAWFEVTRLGDDGNARSDPAQRSHISC